MVCGGNDILLRPLSLRNRTMPAKAQDISLNKSSWIIYIVRCRDGSLYTGITTDLTRRIAEHNSPGGGAKYTRPRRPVTLVYSESTPSRATAAQRESQIKKLNLPGKIRLIAGNPGSGSRPLPSLELPAEIPENGAS
jgi:putative endonuclease